MDFLHFWAVVLGQTFRQIVSIRVMALINTNVVASRHIKREEVLLSIAVRRSKTPDLKFNFTRGNENVKHSEQSEFSGRNSFFAGGIFCLEYPSRRSEKVNCHFLTTDFHFANSRFSFRFVPFRFVSFRFAPFRFKQSASQSEFLHA